jgi:hypothetical protein
MQRRICIGARPYWITTLEENGEWYAVGTFGGETIMVAAGKEADAIALWGDAAQTVRSEAEIQEPE